MAITTPDTRGKIRATMGDPALSEIRPVATPTANMAADVVEASLRKPGGMLTSSPVAKPMLTDAAIPPAAASVKVASRLRTIA